MSQVYDCSECIRREECPDFEPGTFCTRFSSGREMSDQRLRLDAWGDPIMGGD